MSVDRTTGATSIDPAVSTDRKTVFSRRKFRFYDEPHPLIMAMFFVFVVAYYMCWGARREIFSAIRFEFVVGSACVLASIGFLVMRKPNLLPAKNLLIGLGSLFLAMIIQVPFAVDPNAAKLVMNERVVKYAMLAFIMIVLLQSPRYMKWFIFAFLFACFYITQESVQGLISGGLYWQSQGVMRLHGSVRMYAHPNSLAGVAMGVVPFVVFLFPIIKKKYVQLGLVAVFTTSIICVVYSGSRTAYVAILAFLLFWWGTSKHKARFLAIGLVVSLIGLTVLPDQYVDRFKSIGGKEAEGNSKEARIVIVKDAWEIFLSNPGGVGVGSFPAARLARFGKVQDTHNLYLEVATNLGIQGLIVFLCLVWIMLNSFFKANKFYDRQIRMISPILATPGLGGRIRKQALEHYHDMQFMRALSLAGAGFIFVRLVLGIFGMDLYEVYWWFASGLAMCSLNMTVSVNRKTMALIEAGTQLRGRSV